jgi:hypothetical protein
MPVKLSDAAPGSPEAIMARLLGRLQARVPVFQRYDDYYDGVQPLAFASDKFRSAFGNRFREFSSNFMALVVDGTRERLEVTGFRFDDPKGDKDLWEIWQENDLDAGSQLAHTEALIKGVSYAIVEPASGETPRITVEDPLDCIVATDPRDRRKRISALKRWIDDDGHMIVYTYLPDAIYKYRSTRPWTSDATRAVIEGMAPSMAGHETLSQVKFDRLATDGENWPLPNPLGVIPVIPLPNRPRLKTDGQSEIALVLSNQDAINKYRADALIAAEYAAFRQRWAIGIDIPTDPDTGRAMEPFEAAVSHLWAVPPADPNDPNPSPVSFGEFQATDLAPYKLMIDMEVDHISHVSRMPLHQLMGQTQSVPASGEAIKSAETGLIAKCRTSEVFFGDGWEEVMRVTLRAMGDARSTMRTAETLWRNSETRNEAVITDAVVKLWTANGGPNDRPILESYDEALNILGFSPTAIERMETERELVMAEQEAKQAEAEAKQTEAEAANPRPPLSVTRDRASGVTTIGRVPRVG